jgi:hypothetical protein
MLYFAQKNIGLWLHYQHVFLDRGERKQKNLIEAERSHSYERSIQTEWVGSEQFAIQIVMLSIRDRFGGKCFRGGLGVSSGYV